MVRGMLRQFFIFFLIFSVLGVSLSWASEGVDNALHDDVSALTQQQHQDDADSPDSSCDHLCHACADLVLMERLLRPVALTPLHDVPSTPLLQSWNTRNTPPLTPPPDLNT